MANTINWFEIPVVDFERAEEFYTQIFGFKMEKNDMMGFRMGFFPQDKGSVSGAIVKGEGYIPIDHGTLIYLNGGNDLNDVLSKIEPAGGKVLVPKTLITEEIGYFAIFYDPDGNKLALHSLK
ncbi:MAG: VOC family protein [Ignavibacteria bacterium]